MRPAHRVSALLVVTSVLATAPLLEAGAVSLGCSSFAFGDASNSGNGPGGGFNTTSTACTIDWSRAAETDGYYPADFDRPWLVATASGSIAGTLEISQANQNDGLVLSGDVSSSAQAESHAVDIGTGPTPNYFGISTYNTVSMSNVMDVNLAANEVYRYDLDVRALGTGGVYFGLTNEWLGGNGSSVEQLFHRTGTVDGATWATFLLNISSGNTASAPGPNGLPDYEILTSGAASYRLALTPVPIPAALLLLGSAVAGLLPFARRRRYQRDGE